MENTIIKYFDLLYESMHFPIQVINQEGKLVYINSAFSFQWGYTLSELKEYSIHNDYELKNSGTLELITACFDNKKSFSANNYSDSLLKNKDITIPIFRTKIFPIEFEGQTFVILFHEDQTEMILTEEEVKKARDGYKEAERLKNTFLNVLSHELRTPLNIVLGYSSIIKESLKDKISAEDKIYLDNLHSGSERLFKSITQMLEFAQLEAGKYSSNIETVELITVIQNCLENFSSHVEEKKLDIKTHFKENAIFVDVDIHCVENAINNLLSNAVKFTKQGFIEIEVDIIDQREIAVCKIKDSGVGISSEYLDHLFRPFSQEDLNIGRNFEGNGLGLALAKRYIEKMGGSLLVDSIKGVGSTFSFTLPLSQNISRSDKRLEKSNGKKAKKILMLDDSSGSFDLLNAFLKNVYEIDIFDFKEFKLDYLKNERYEVIIFDVNQNQWQKSISICRDIKKNDLFKRPLIILSSAFMDDKIKEFYSAGVDKFLVKPFSKSDLMSALQEVVS